ncbi:hypothetical protein DNTS_021663, partial [Danionella cerebrum]
IQDNLTLKQEQEKALEELRLKLVSLQVHMKEFQTELHALMMYKNESSLKEQQKIEKLETAIALSHTQFEKLSDHFQKSLRVAVEKSEQQVNKYIEDGAQLAVQRAVYKLDDYSKEEMEETTQLNEQVQYFIDKIALLETSVKNLQEENLDRIKTLFHMTDPLLGIHVDLPARLENVEANGMLSFDSDIMKMIFEESSELLNGPLSPLQPLATGIEESDAMQSRSATPPKLKDVCRTTKFTGPVHLALLKDRLLCVTGKACPLHPRSEEVQKWAITTKMINAKFQQAGPSVSHTCKTEQQLDEK